MQDGASAFILDLRDNSGGVVGSGYSIAQLLLNVGDGFCVVKFGTGEEEIVNMQEASHLVTQPLVNSFVLCIGIIQKLAVHMNGRHLNMHDRCMHRMC